MKKIWAILCAFLLAFSAPTAFCAYSENADAGKTTVMAYICGSNLEQWGCAATDDIAEMLAAKTGGAVNLVLETGGSKRWHDPMISGGTVQRFLATNGALSLIDDVGAKSMAEKSTLTDFIQFAAQKCPAERYILIFWDHGGGSVYGFGRDELFGEKSLPVKDIAGAVADAGVKFDMICFDACLMATYETGLALSPYADYLIASENTEPSGGYSYAGFLSYLMSDPAARAQAIGKKLIDDYIAVCDTSIDSQNATLSMIDLKALAGTSSAAVEEFAARISEQLSGAGYAAISKARASAKAFGYQEQEMVDMIDLVRKTSLDANGQIESAIRASILYNGVCQASKDACGLSVYFPYGNLSAMADMQALYAGLPGAKKYGQMASAFATIRASGNSGQNYSTATWYDGTVAQNSADYIAQNHLTGEEIKLIDKGDHYAMHLTDEEWALIDNVQLQFSVFDEGGQIVMGLDDAVNYDADGDLIADFDNTWVALNGEIVPFYSGDYVENGDYFRYTGYVPVELNGENMELALAWDNEHPNGVVLGARPEFADSVTTAHGLVALKKGDNIQAYCEYYPDDSDETTEYYFGDPIVYDGALTVSYEDIGTEDTGAFCFALTDLYGNTYWTESISF